jgi:hypothetical protein
MQESEIKLQHNMGICLYIFEFWYTRGNNQQTSITYIKEIRCCENKLIPDGIINL